MLVCVFVKKVSHMAANIESMSLDARLEELGFSFQSAKIRPQ